MPVIPDWGFRLMQRKPGFVELDRYQLLFLELKSEVLRVWRGPKRNGLVVKQCIICAEVELNSVCWCMFAEEARVWL